jgi:hypothetical protein
MNLANVIQLLYPDADLIHDIQIQDNGEGEFINHWNENLYGPKPTEKELLDKIPELQAQFDLIAVLRSRKDEYPSTDELIIALWEKNMGGNSVEVDALEAKRQAVKTKYPK